MKISKVITAVLLISGMVTTAFAGNDPGIKGKVRTNIQAAMNEHVGQNTLGEKYVIYDAVDGALKKLTFKKLHEGIVKKGDFYVSCADFVDGQGRKYDIDFLVVEKDGSFRVLQPLVHSIDGKKRAYHLED